MSRHDLRDEEYVRIVDLLPPERPGGKGRPFRPHRDILNGILWILTTGSPWRDLPEEFGPWQTVYGRFRRWTREGLWEEICERLLFRLDEQGKLDRTLWCVDGSVVRAHRCAAGAQRQHEELTQEQSSQEHALGRSRGGFSTKLHLVVDSRGLPLAVILTPGQHNECTCFEELMRAVPLVEFEEEVNPDYPDAVAGDKGYSTRGIREWLQEHCIEDVIPTRKDQPRDERFDREKYRRRNIVERVIGWLKEKRRVFARYEKLAAHYLAMVRIAIIRRLINA